MDSKTKFSHSIMKHLLTLGLFSFFTIGISAQIYIGDITLETQAQVDSFPITCNCSAISGYLKITGTQINNLDSLEALTEIQRYLKIADNELLSSIEGLQNIASIDEDFELIDNPQLLSLSGLESLTMVGKDVIIDNIGVSSFDGLQNLQVIGDGLSIFENPNLVSIDSLYNLTSIDEFIYIYNNPALVSIIGLSNVGPVFEFVDIGSNEVLESIDGIDNAAVNLNSHLRISGNDLITNVDALSNLEAIDGDLRISRSDSLKNLDGLGSLHTLAGTLYFRQNQSLLSIDSLQNLTEIGGDLWIENNPKLVSLFGLSNVTSIGGFVRIKLNDSLPSLDPLAAVDTVYSFIEIIDNSDLSECCVLKCWPYDVTTGSITVQNNEVNCNSMVEIDDTCAQACNGSITLVDLKLFLEGPYQSNMGMMHTDLNDLDMDIIATRQPYKTAPYNYPGGEIVSVIPIEMVDWVLVEARTGEPKISGNRNTETVETKAGILLSDGKVVGSDGVTPLQFFALNDSTEYRFCIRHRNHLDVLSSNPVMGGAPVSYDFTTDASASFGFQQLKNLGDGSYGLFVGDYNQDNVIQTTDIDLWLLEPAVLNVYDNTDGNIDGIIQVSDFDKWFFNKAKVGSVEVQY